MLKLPKIPSSEITPEALYRARRSFIGSTAGLIGGLALASCGTEQETVGQGTLHPTSSTIDQYASKVDELGESLTSYQNVTEYNNFYEFTGNKDVYKHTRNFKSEPWTLEVGGLVKNPKTYALEDLAKAFPTEERIYRLRCVEAWSMVIPWEGFQLSKLIAAAEPTAEAKYVRFETIVRPEEMPGQKQSIFYSWPYIEGLRLDEAMNDLPLLVTGVYGQALPAQNGAPIRLAVPWKYGFKSIKSIVKIELVANQPVSLWMQAAPNEYGFYANVNPAVNHPRWSQATERRIGDNERRPTIVYNGYGEQVAYLYQGMDLSTNY